MGREDILKRVSMGGGKVAWEFKIKRKV